MNKFFIVMTGLLLVSCKHSVNKDVAQKEIFQTEKAFEKMVSEKGLAEAFYFFADDNAVILRGNDSLITGKENIKHYYTINANPNAKLNWNPDYIYVSDCGTLAYTYGKFVFSIQDSSGKKIERNGVFHTVWKKRRNAWKFLWD
jgi:ketosteroid isomerase-like protein